MLRCSIWIITDRKGAGGISTAAARQTAKGMCAGISFAEGQGSPHPAPIPHPGRLHRRGSEGSGRLRPRPAGLTGGTDTHRAPSHTARSAASTASPAEVTGAAPPRGGSCGAARAAPALPSWRRCAPRPAASLGSGVAAGMAALSLTVDAGSPPLGKCGPGLAPRRPDPRCCRGSGGLCPLPASLLPPARVASCGAGRAACGAGLAAPGAVPVLPIPPVLPVPPVLPIPAVLPPIPAALPGAVCPLRVPLVSYSGAASGDLAR